MRAWLRRVLGVTVLKRLAWHAKRVTKGLDSHFFLALFTGLIVVVVLAAIAVTVLEPRLGFGDFGDSVHWAVTSVIGSGDSSFVASGGGRVVSWLLALFGVGILATMTGALVGFVIDFILKEGQGMGAAGYEGHIVICGWNATAKNLIKEFATDDYDAEVVVIADLEHNPAEDAYFIRGDATSEETLRRAGVHHAEAAIIFPADSSDEADMRSVLVVLAVEALAPQVRTLAEVNNPAHIPHFKRAGVDEVLATTRMASHLIARSAMYPGLTAVVEDIVSGGDGSELYRVRLPDGYAGSTVADIAARLRVEHHATLLAVTRNGSPLLNPPADHRMEPSDEVVVVAESLGDLISAGPA